MSRVDTGVTQTMTGIMSVATPHLNDTDISYIISDTLTVTVRLVVVICKKPELRHLSHLHETMVLVLLGRGNVEDDSDTIVLSYTMIWNTPYIL